MENSSKGKMNPFVKGNIELENYLVKLLWNLLQKEFSFITGNFRVPLEAGR